MSITHITSTQQLSQILSASGTKLSVIDFHATWCGPCHAIAPAFEKFSKEYKSVNFLKCDVDAAQDVAQKYAVRAMPTFVFLKGSNKVAEVKGADPRGLESTLKKHAQSDSGAFTGQGHTLGGESPSNSSTGPKPAGTPVITIPDVTKLDPQIKLLLGLFGVYLVLWYLSS